MTYARLLTRCSFLCLVAFLSTHVSLASDCKSCGKSALLCGPYCMLSICRQLGVETTLDEMKALCGYDDKAGTTLAGLTNAAKAKGLQAVAAKIRLDELFSFNRPAIAHLWDNHFVVIDVKDPDNVIVTNPPAGPRTVKNADFSKAYSGFALLVRKDAFLFPKPEPNGPDLRLDVYTWDFGSVYQGDAVKCTLRYRNVGSTDLVISNVGASCTCVVVTGYARSTPPGGEGTIDLLVNTNDQRGGLDKSLVIASNDPITPRVVASVTGYVKPKQLLMSPRSINFAKHRRTQSATCAVYVPSQQSDAVKVLSVSSNSPLIDASFSKSTDDARPGYIISVALKAGAPIGHFKAAVTVNSDHGRQPKAEIPVTATILGNIDLDHDSFYLGIAKKGSEKKCVMDISTVSKDPLKIGKIDCSLSCVSVEATPKTEGKEYVLTATLKPDAPLGNIKGEVTIHTNDPDQPEIRVPVYAYVEQAELAADK